MQKAIKHKDQIWEIQNFLSNDEISLYFDVIKNISENEWKNTRNWRIKDQKELMLLTEQIRQRILSYFKNYKSFIGIVDIQRLIPNSYLDCHQDINTNEEEKNKIVYGTVVYLNDNFTGGELYYPEIDFKIKAVSGSLIIHKSEYFHGVFPVKTGIRYMLTLFVTGDENTKCLII